MPGVTSFLASAAALGTQLTLPGVTQTMIITRAEARTKVPKREQISELAKHQATLIFYLSVHLLNKISKEAIEGGYKKTTPVAVVYRASRKDQKIIIGTLTDIASKVKAEKITMTAIVIIGDVIKPKSYEYSKLYDKTFTHGFRKAKTKVRKFNFYNYTRDLPEVVQMAMNPDVSIRFRGVMEKCTYCYQRVSAARISAENENREIQDGDFQVACQQSCPADAIKFGDINDPNSAVSKAKRRNRDYALLAHLGTAPRTTYLAKIRNQNPKLSSNAHNGSHH